MTPLPSTLLADYQARLAEPSHRDGGGNDIKDELPYLLDRARRYPGFRALEIGVRSGRSTSAFLAAATLSAAGGHLWSVDQDPPDVPAWWHSCGYWTFKQARSADVVPELEGWPKHFDVLFIDGDHSVGGALADLRRFVPYVARGGVVMCHDTRLLSCAVVGIPYEVAAALDLFCAEYRLGGPPLTWTERGGQFGLGVIEAPNG